MTEQLEFLYFYIEFWRKRICIGQYMSFEVGGYRDSEGSLNGVEADSVEMLVLALDFHLLARDGLHLQAHAVL